MIIFTLLENIYLKNQKSFGFSSSLEVLEDWKNETDDGKDCKILLDFDVTVKVESW